MTVPNPTPVAAPETAAQMTSPNGQAHTLVAAPSPLTKTRVPQSKKATQIYRYILPAIALGVVAVGVATWFFFFRGPQVQAGATPIKVEYKNLQLKVVERGTLEAINNNDVKCNVKAGSRGAPKIMWVIDQGTPVEKGDLLVRIDASTLVEQATNQEIALNKARADMIAAQQAEPITEENLKKWDLGDYPQTLEDYKGQIQVSDSNYQQQKDRTAWVSRMVKKGYMTVSQEEAERANEEGFRLDLVKKQKQLEVLEKYTNPVEHNTRKNAVTTAQADLASKVEVFKQQEALYKDLLQQIEGCEIHSPSDGIVVYFASEQTRMGAGSTQSIIAQGEPVQFGQTMLRVPDLAHMQVNVRVHEAFINHMDVKARLDEVTEGGPADKAGLKKDDVITKFGNKPIKSYTALLEALRSHHKNDKVKLKVLRDNKESGTGTEELDLEITLAKPKAPEPKATSGNSPDPISQHIIAPDELFGATFQIGLPATIEITAIPGKVLKGHVKSVASVAAQQDWMSPDVKVYQAYVEIDDPVKDLNIKPGLSADCKILTEDKAVHVLAVPMQAVLNPLEKGGKPRCYVMSANGLWEAREVELGLNDNVYYEVKDGLKEGDVVADNPRAFLGDKEKKMAGESQNSGGKSGAGKGPGGPSGKGK